MNTSQNPDQPGPVEDGFASVWAHAETIPGWLTRDQGFLLHDRARRVRRGGTLLEIGSHQGRSTVVLAKVAQQLNLTLVAVDPFVEGRLFGGLSTKDLFEQHLRQAAVEDDVELVQEYSTRLRPTWSRPLDYLYIDGKHDYWTLSDDLLWVEHLQPGSPVLIHDCYSSIGVTLGILRHVLLSRTLRYDSRAGSLALFYVGTPRLADRVAILREIPWWIRNVGIKVLLRLRLRAIARAVGHDSPYDPY